MKLICLLSFLFALPAGAEMERRGWDNGNAGDTYTAEFILTARHAVERMKLLPQSELKEIDLNRLSGAVLNAKVHSEERLVLNGYEVDAINYPDRQEIVVSRSRWRVLRKAQHTTNRLMLVVHEYLFLAGVDDTQFRVSGRIVPLMNVKDFNPNRWWNPLNPVNRISMNLEFQSPGCSLDGLEFDLQKSEEMATVKTSENCGAVYREVIVWKSSFTAPPSSGARGVFHRYHIQVRDRQGQVIGSLTYEPSWGECLLPQDGTCKLSGKIFVGGVELTFWLAR